jgi:hypothetical protein
MTMRILSLLASLVALAQPALAQPADMLRIGIRDDPDLLDPTLYLCRYRCDDRAVR